MNTRKKVKVVGTEIYTNNATGEIREMQVVSIEERDANFHKIWIANVIQCLDLIGNKKIQIMDFLLKNMDSENKICLSLRQMAQKSNVSLETCRTTINALKSANFIKQINSGAYQINPDIIFKGGKGSRMNILLKYQQVDSNEVE